MTPDQLRSSFLEFFQQRQHEIVRSSPVVPEGDPTLLFTNAGMNQFKDVLLGLEKRDYSRATSVQKCIRAGGKHNDLDEVGKDGRHLTFFEMLGNWSFGDYYKVEAIRWAWEYVTSVLQLPAERLYVSVYKDDDESEQIWREHLGLAADRIIRLGDIERGDEENFWSMGPTGPCGPCTEIYFDQHAGSQPDAPWAPGFDEERFLEIWNLVFMEFDRNDSGELAPLPIKSVDTGMGLERVAAILEDVDSVFRTAIFRPIIEHTHSLLTGDERDAAHILSLPDATSYCVIADHIRSLLFCVSEGATFSNEGRGYVLRRILRRAVRFGRTLGFDAPFLHRVATAVVDNFGAAWPELRLKQREAAEIIRQEEERFFRTLDRGIALFDTTAAEAREAGLDHIPGSSVFRLYDTFGFPPDLTRIMAEEVGLGIDEEGYEQAMEAQRERSRSADDRYTEAGEWTILEDGAADQFVGYDHMEVDTRVLRFRAREESGVFDITLLQSPFYPESGGQVGDRGTLTALGAALTLDVLDTRRTTAGITHTARVTDGSVTGEALADGVRATVSRRHRFLTACNHTATHLLHAALHRFVSESAFQAGSLVAPDRLRFDFNHGRPLTDDQLQQIESWVNDRIREDVALHIRTDVPLAEAEDCGAMMIFGEKYGDRVRVVDIPGHSTELCGGIHVNSTRDIAWFRVVSEGGVAAGVRRIEAVTNEGAFERAEQQRMIIRQLEETLKSREDALAARVEGLLGERSAMERRLQELSTAAASSAASTLLDVAEEIEGGVSVIASRVEVDDREALLAMADALRPKLDRAAVLLASVIGDKPALLVLVSDAALASSGLKAGQLVNAVAAHIEGRGGGKPGLAQAGGTRAEGIDAAIAAFPTAVKEAMRGA